MSRRMQRADSHSSSDPQPLPTKKTNDGAELHNLDGSADAPSRQRHGTRTLKSLRNSRGTKDAWTWAQADHESEL